MTFAAPVEIAGDGYVGVVIAKELLDPKDGTHRFYLHEVALQESLQSEEFKTGMITGSKPGDIANILQEIVTAKDNVENVSEGTAKTTESGSERYSLSGEPERGMASLDDATGIGVRAMEIDRTTKEYKKKVSDAAKRVEERLAELHRSDGVEQSPKSNPVGNSADLNPDGNYSPDMSGAQSAAQPAAKVNKNFIMQALWPLFCCSSRDRRQAIRWCRNSQG